jgi:hypothetical protein
VAGLDAVDGGRWRGRQRAARRPSAAIPTVRIAALFMVHLLDGQAPACLSKTYQISEEKVSGATLVHNKFPVF